VETQTVKRGAATHPAVVLLSVHPLDEDVLLQALQVGREACGASLHGVVYLSCKSFVTQELRQKVRPAGKQFTAETMGSTAARPGGTSMQ